MKNLTFLLLIVLFSLTNNAFSKGREISGKVVNYNTNEPISDIKIKIKDIDISTLTDEAGKYKLWIPNASTTIQFSEFNNMRIVEVKIVSEDVIDVYLSSKFDDLFNLTLEQLMNTEVISATGDLENINTAPAAIYAISSKQIDERGYQNLLELLQDQPAFDFDIQHGGWVSQVAYLRGTRSNSILIMIDGMIQNNINEGEMDKYHTISLFNISRVEIITGPATALYGANALVGVINLITKNPDEINGIQASGGYTSSIGDEMLAFNKYNINTVFGKQFARGIGVTASFNAILSDDQGMDYYDPDNFYVKDHIKYDDPVVDDGFDNHQNDYIGSIRLTKDNVFTFGIDYADIDEGLGSMRNGSWYYVNNDSIDVRWHTRRASAFSSYKFIFNEKFSITPKLYYRNDQTVNNSGFARTYGSTKGVFRGWKQQSYRNGIDVKFDWNILDNLSFMGGVVYENSQTANEVIRTGTLMNNYNNIINQEEEYDTYELEYDDDDNLIDTLLITDTYQNNIPIMYINQYSLYYQIVYDLNQNFKFLFGGRYYKETEIKGVFTPRAGLVFNKKKLFAKKDQFIVKLMYGQAFKALANDEKYEDNILREDLLPAKSTTYEVSTVYLPTSNSKFELTGWYNNIDNYYVYGTACEEDNITQKTYGFQAVGEFKIGRFIIGANYTYTDGQNEGQWYQYESYAVPDSTSYEKLIRVSKHKVNASLTYAQKKMFFVNLKMKYVGERNVSPINLKYGNNEGFYVPRNFSGDFTFPEDDYTWQGTGNMPGYMLLNFNIGTHDLGSITPSLKGISFNFRISNILNTNYLETPLTNSRSSAPYNPQPGRRFTVKLAYRLPF